jgi:hypothetical protein
MAGSELLVLNPGRRRRGRRTKAKHRVNRRRRRVVARHNPARKHRRRRRNPVARHRRARRNPSTKMLGINFQEIGMLAAGGVITEVLADKLASVLPADWKTSNADMVRIGSKAAIGVGLPLIARKFLPRGWGNAIAIGGGVVTLLDIIKTYVAPHIPGLTLSGYEIGPTGLSTATIAQGGGLGTFYQAPSGGMSGSAYDDGVYGPIV